MDALKTLAQEWFPPIVLRILRRIRSECGHLDGYYATWEEAASLCTGYDAELILDKVLASTLKVKRGEAVHERDSVLFDRVEYSWPVTCALMWAAAQKGGRLHVLDFGGALGSTYFQNRLFLADLSELTWSIVEQLNFVSAGREHIEDEILKFFPTIESCLKVRQPSVILLSSVLQYLSDPKSLMNRLSKTGAEWWIVDRTPFLKRGVTSGIHVQRVPETIYPASYPCHCFNENEFTSWAEDFGYTPVVTFDSLDKLSPLATWKGFIFRRKGT